MEYIRMTSTEDPLFRKMYKLIKKVFPPEKVLDFYLWKETLENPHIHVYVAFHNGEVVGATKYVYLEEFNVAMIDFTIIGKEHLGVGRFLLQKRMQDLQTLAASHGNDLFGMFAEVYNPYRVEELPFGLIIPMDPFVQREVLSNLGYLYLDFPYVHPSCKNGGEAVSHLDLCFQPMDDQEMDSLPSKLIVDFLIKYYAFFSNKPSLWYKMIHELKQKQRILLRPL